MAQDIIVRKSVNSLTDREKKDFIEAVLALKNKPGEFAQNKYDEFVLWHAKTMSSPAGTDAAAFMRNLAHAGPIFLPWHREFLYRFEQALGHEVPGVSIPYWNWEVDAEKPNLPPSFEDPKESAVWKDDFMGGDGDPDDDNIVKRGPLKGWVTVEVDQHTADPIGNSSLRRTLGRDPSLPPELLSLPNQTDIYNALKYDFYDSPYWDRSSRGFRNALEGWIPPNIHNRVHLWVGGSMQLSTSPNDPVFFLHHCNIDRIWAIWQTLQVVEQYPRDPPGIKDRNNKRIDYFNLNDKMFPWNDEPDAHTIKMVLNHSNLRYIYDVSALSLVDGK
jgi:tyrosinase